MDFEDTNKSKQVIATIAVMLVVVLIVFGARAFDRDDITRRSREANSAKSVTDTTISTATPAATPTPTSNATQPTTYKDGTYSATGGYSSPGGLQTIGVRLTVQNDIVTAATVTDQATDQDSEEYQLMFIGGYKKYVVGKKIDSIHVSHVSGSSLTSQGFNSALMQIKKTAHV
jgi:uncharacterized protein with FMN-binding domain